MNYKNFWYKINSMFVLKGVLCGLFTGEFFGIWILVGSLAYPKQQSFLTTSVAQCPPGLVTNSTVTGRPPTQSEGILGLYHIAYLLVPVLGFILSLSVGAIMSLISGITQ